jgi:lysophospholipase L1-like esterase
MPSLGVEIGRAVRAGVPPPPVPVARYDVWLVAGQSNAQGRAGREAGDGDVEGVYQFPTRAGAAGYRTITGDITPLMHPEGGDWLGPGEAFARALLPQLPAERRILLVPCAVGATALVAGAARWAPGSPGGDLYENAIAQANAALAAAKAELAGSRFAGVLWVQGESDGSFDGGNTPPAAYHAAMEALIAGFRARISGAASVPFLIGGMVPEFIAGAAANAAIADAQVATALTSAGVRYAPGPAGRTFDALHFNAAGVRALGSALAGLVTDVLGPTIVTPATAGVASEARLAVPLAAEGFATFSIVAGSDAALFEVASSHGSGALVSVLRWSGNGTRAGPENRQVIVQARDGAGNTSVKGITVAVAEPVTAPSVAPLAITGVGYAAGKFGQGLAAGRASVPVSVLPANLPKPVTIEAWVKTTASALQVVAGQTLGGGVGWYMGTNEAGQAQAYTGGANMLSAGPVNDGAWHHLALVLGTDASRFYVDGVPSGTGPVASGDAGVSVRFYNGGFDFAGTVDELLIWSGERYVGGFTPAGAAQAGGASGLIAAYPLDGNGEGWGGAA